MKRDDHISSLVARDYILEVRRQESQLLLEGYELKEMVRDLVKVAAGAGAVALSGGMGGDTVVDIVFALEGSKDVIQTLGNLGASKELNAAIEAALNANISSGPDSVYEAVLDVAKTADLITPNFVEDAADQVDKLISKLAGAIGEWVSTALPDDAGLGGIALREAIESAVGMAAENAFELLKGAFNSLPKEVQGFIADPAKFVEYMNKLIDVVIQALENYMSGGDSGGEGEEGFFATIGDVAGTIGKIANPVGNVQQFVISQATSRLIPKAITYLDKDVRGMLPEAAQIFNKVVTVAFGAIALLQILEKKEYEVIKAVNPDDVKTESILRLYVRNMLTENLA